jgi:DNA repair protein RadC
MAKHLTPINQVRLYYKRPHVSEMIILDHTSVVADKLRTVIEDGILDLKEYYWVALLTADNRLLGISEINSGTVVEVKLFVREIMQLALLSNAVGIVLIHNHPSGSLIPSEKDIEATKKILEIGKLMDVHLQDHIIITSEDHTSIFSRMGW